MLLLTGKTERMTIDDEGDFRRKRTSLVESLHGTNEGSRFRNKPSISNIRRTKRGRVELSAPRKATNRHGVMHVAASTGNPDVHLDTKSLR